MARLESDGKILPVFVKKEFDNYLRCGRSTIKSIGEFLVILCLLILVNEAKISKKVIQHCLERVQIGLVSLERITPRR